MNSPLQHPQVQVLVASFRRNWKWVAGPTAVGAALALLYVLFTAPKWQATQTLLVRDEATGSQLRQGRFDSADAMKTAQETILELSKNQLVVEGALREAGPSNRNRGKNWPTSDDVEKLRDAIKVRAPKGAMFGATEVLYLSITDRDPKRAVQLTTAVCNQLDSALRDVRVKKGQSMTAELERGLALAQADLQQATEALEKIEQSVGSDLPELRVLNESGAGEGNLRQQLNQIESEIRAARQAQEDIRKTREHLMRVNDDPDQINAVSTLVLDRLPAIRRLKDGLLEAQLRTSELSGRMTGEHPKVIAAKQAETAVRQELIREVKLGLQSSAADLEAYEARVKSLTEQAEEVRERFARLAQVRAEYGNLTATVKRRAEVVQKAEKDLADARAMVEAARTTSLLTRVDQPSTGDRPVGPGKMTVFAGGIFAGVLVGCGIVVLMTPIGQTTMRRRLSDWIAAPFGRRATDRAAAGQGGIFWGRRATDVAAANAATNQGPPRRRATDQPPQASSDPPRRRAEDRIETEPAAKPRVYSEVS